MNLNPGYDRTGSDGRHDGETILVYDGECPVCSSYVTYIRLRKSVGRVKLVNARADAQWRQCITAEGFDLDEGMVLIFGGAKYHGADCVHMLALLSTRSGFFNQLNGLIFRRQRLARLIYPILRTGRNTLLRLLGRKKFGATR